MVETGRAQNFTVDTLLDLQASTTETITGASSTEIDTQPQVAAAEGRSLTEISEVRGEMIIDVTAIEIASNDELYTFVLSGSDTAGFTAGAEEELAIIRVGANEVLVGDTDSDTGRYVVPFTNRRNGRLYRFVRLEWVIAGTIATGITFSARLAKMR